MNTLFYDTAEALIYDPVPANRMATRSALYALGFRKIETVASTKAFTDFLRKQPPDIALCEMKNADGDLCALIQSVRHGTEGANPFVVIIATAWENNAALLSRTVDSGADDLLLRPFSTALLQSRIETHIQRRKGFVITTNYIGPDRRRDQTRASNVELFDPPNSLRMKTKERLTPDEIARRMELELQIGRDRLNSEKLRRDIFQICIQWRLLQDQIPGHGKYDEQLAQISDLARSVAKRCRDSESDQGAEWCESIQAAIQGLQYGVDRNASMHLLGHAAVSLNQMFHPERDACDQLAQIDTTVTTIRAREAQKLAS